MQHEGWERITKLQEKKPNEAADCLYDLLLDIPSSRICPPINKLNVGLCVTYLSILMSLGDKHPKRKDTYCLLVAQLDNLLEDKDRLAKLIKGFADLGKEQYVLSQNQELISKLIGA